MFPPALSDEILAIRTRLSAIEDERHRLSQGAHQRRARLKDEEQRLRARLFKLQDSGLKDRDTMELPGIPGFPPVPPPD